jgi:1-deoxy-D-xylulose-5-phosphate synthase
LHDICLQNLPVILCLDRAGLVGEDGATHHGTFDMAFLRTIPNINILAPKDENELRQMIFSALEQEKPVAIRYPRGSGFGVEVAEVPQKLNWGKSEYVLKTADAQISIFAVGSMVNVAEKVARLLNLPVNVINGRFVKPLDKNILFQESKAKFLVTIEEGILNGGYGAAVAEFLADENISTPILRFGIKDKFIEHGTRTELLEICGLTAKQIAEKILEVKNGQGRNF